MDDLQAKLTHSKREYKTALKNLEMISDEIHERRRSVGLRERGVGSEGDGITGDDITNFKIESDGISSKFILISGITDHAKNLKSSVPNVTALLF